MLSTNRLSLRAVRPSDTQSLAHHANDRDIAKFLLVMPHPYGLKDAQVYIEMQLALNAPGQSYAICIADEVVGCIGTIGEFGYWLVRAHWGKGIATEAALAVLTQHFEVDGWDLDSSHSIENPASGRVLANCGFRYGGKTARRVGKFEGQDQMHRHMILTRSDWEARP